MVEKVVGKVQLPPVCKTCKDNLPLLVVESLLQRQGF